MLQEPESKINYYKSKNIEKIEYKGQYGVSFTWNDGHYADIFSFEVLRAICEEVNIKND